MTPKITLEQWAAFKAVVDCGSFTKAAEQLNKSQSTVSYNLAKMEERLPAAVFEQTGRKAELTEFGHSMYRHASTLLTQALQIDQVAQYLASGWQDEVVIAIDALVPMEPVFKALQHFSQQSPETRIRILETTLSGTDEVLINRDADIVITSKVVPGFLSENYGQVRKVPVASSTHPLSQESHLSEGDLTTHRQIVIRDSGTKRNQDAGWLKANQRWTVSNFATSIAAIKAGLGFGFMPLEMVQADVDQGGLVVLDLDYGQGQSIPLYIVATAQSHAGAATKAVLKCLLEHK